MLDPEVTYEPGPHRREAIRIINDIDLRSASADAIVAARVGGARVHALLELAAVIHAASTPEASKPSTVPARAEDMR